MGQVTVRLEAETGEIAGRTSPQSGARTARTFGGHGADTDIIVASARAYLSALNKLLEASGKYGEFSPKAEVAAPEKVA